MPHDNKEFLILIFSRDRALQLEGLLDSFLINCLDHDKCTINVLYTTTETLIKDQYAVLQRRYSKNKVHFLRESDFQQNLNGLIYRYGVKNSLHNLLHKVILDTKPRFVHRNSDFFLIHRPFYVFFIVDDTIFTSPFFLEEIKQSLVDNPDALGFSLRLGLNTNYCYMLDTEQNIPNYEVVGDNKIKFRWVESQYDFGFPLELSSSIYRSQQLLPIMLKLWYRNPNTLEMELHNRRQLYAHEFPCLLSYKTSVAFANPINLVQNEFTDNRFSIDQQFTSMNLARLFEEGYRIDIEKLQGNVSNSCHMETSIPLIKRSLEEIL